MKQKVKGKEHITAKEWYKWILFNGDNFLINKRIREGNHKELSVYLNNLWAVS